MAYSVLMKVNKRMKDACVKVQRDVAEHMKRRYNLDKIEVQGTLASKIIAEKVLGTNRFVNYRLHRIKNGLGRIEIV